MSKAEIDRKYDQIVDFAGIADFMSMPIKRYSSGMRVRLGFSVAAHLEPEILVIDEVLAVGDNEFQQKCLGKMRDVATEGRTVLFVSHNMTAVKNLCNTCILLRNGQLFKIGSTEHIVDLYFEQNIKSISNEALRLRTDRTGNGKLKFTNFEILNTGNVVYSGEKAILRTYFEVSPECVPLRNIAFSLSINTVDGSHALVFFTQEQNKNIRSISNGGFIDCMIDEFPLSSGHYLINLYASVNGTISDYIKNASIFIVDDSHHFKDGQSKHPSHPIYLAKHDWVFKEYH